MLDTKPKEISEIQRLNYEQVIDTIFVILKQVILTYRYIHWSLSVAFLFFWIFVFYFIYFFIQQVLICHPFYAHQCIHVNPNLPIHHTTATTPRHFPPLVSLHLFSTSVSQFLPCKPVHLYHFSRFHL